jgi:hypothetical protein
MKSSKLIFYSSVALVILSFGTIWGFGCFQDYQNLQLQFNQDDQKIRNELMDSDYMQATFRTSVYAVALLEEKTLLSS